ncbi:MAG: type secretion apparatus protein OrgA/MxiK [Herbaspirillum sp.]|nr:type secretion apparatus protein OrgA/MxiK [Herbaspirillum sp.]
MVSTHLRTVMFDPVSYIHPLRLQLPAAFNNPRRRSIVNRMLLDHYDLSEKEPRLVPGGIDHLLVNHWQHLPRLALLLGCQRFRSALLHRGLLLKLPAWARSFAVLPLHAAASNSPTQRRYDGVLDEGILRAYGLSALLRHCRSCAPALKQRIPLLFPAPAMRTEEIPAEIYPTENDNILLILAIQHVKKFSGGASLCLD